jgi:hypothetical protein
MDSRVLLEVASFARGQAGVGLFAKPALHALKLGSWITAVLLSLGLWAAAIWAAVVVFAGRT